MTPMRMMKMMPRQHLGWMLVLLCAVLATGTEGQDGADDDGTTSQDQAQEEQSGQGEATTVDTAAQDIVVGDEAELEPLMPLEELNLRLRPMRQEQLAIEVEAWMTRVQAIAQHVAELRLELMRAESSEVRTVLLERIASLDQWKEAVIDRAQTVLDAYEAKGGTIETELRYLTAIGGIEVDVTDATGLWIYMRNWLTSPEGGIRIGLNIVKAIVVLVIFWILAKVTGSVVRRALNRLNKTSSLLREFLTGLSSKMIIVIGAVMAASMIGMNIGPLVAAIGAAGLVVGLALQGTLSNFASGILILIYRPFDIGDWITAAGQSGKVDSMSLVTTSIITADNQKIIMPNNSIWNGVITNITGRPTRRVDMTFGISYDDDIDKAMSVLMDILQGHELVLDDPAPVVEVTALADSSVNLIARPWAKTDDYWRIFWDIQAEVKRRFDREGIGIPYPQMDVYLHNRDKKA